MPQQDYCCAFGCNNRRINCPGVSFHYFPREEPQRSQWIHAVGRDVRKGFAVTGNTVVCSDHFEESCFWPSITCGVDGEGTLAKRPYRRLRPKSVPTIFSFRPQAKHRPSPAERQAVAEERQRQASLPVYGPPTFADHLSDQLAASESRSKDLERQVEVLKQENRTLRSQLLRFENVRLDHSQLEYLTGLSKRVWDTVWKFLHVTPTSIVSRQAAARNERGRKISPGSGRRAKLSLEDQFLLTMMRLRLGRFEQELAYQFGISKASVSRIFILWINFLYLRLGMIPIWPRWEAVQKCMPDVFKTFYPKTFVIIDATELRVQTPSELSAQSQHYSDYKSHTTLKGLVGIAPNGAFTFLSQLYSGVISDRQLVIESGFLNFLDSVPAGCGVMADRGFEIQDLLVKSGLVLNMPPFKGSASLSAADVIKTQRIASARIHVERAIGRVKNTFHILSGDIPLAMIGSMNQTWSVCAMLTNFFGPLIKDSPA